MRVSLTAQILSALALGALTGWLQPSLAAPMEILATVFIRLILVIVAPLIFSTLVVGIAGQGDLRRLGSLALRTFGLFILVTTLSLAIAFTLGNLLRPGRGITATVSGTPYLGTAPAESFWIRLVPSSAVDAMARGDVLQIVVFSILFAAAVSLAGSSGLPILELCRSLVRVMYRFTDVVMKVAPLGVFGAAAAMAGRQGLQVGASFLRLIGAVYLGLALLLLVLYPALALLLGIPLRRLYQAVKEPFAVAFATASASAAVPKAMESMEAMGISRSVVSFTIGTGLNFNPSGSTLFVGVASLFIIQAFSIPMTVSDQAILFGTLFVATKGIGGVPRSSLVVVAAALPAVGVAPEVAGAGVGLLLGIDPLLDMPRTAVNTAGNCLAAALVARSQSDGERAAGRERGPEAEAAAVPK